MVWTRECALADCWNIADGKTADNGEPMTYPNIGPQCTQQRLACERQFTAGQAREDCLDQQLGIDRKCEDIGFKASMCPKQHTYPIKLLHSYLDQAGALFLFFFLIISTPMDDIAYACLHGLKWGSVPELDLDDNPVEIIDPNGVDGEMIVKMVPRWSPGEFTDAYHTLKYSWMCDDTFFYKLSYILNLFCYAMVILCTYLLFIVSPTADNLLLNVLALQFLLDVDNICYDGVMDGATKYQLVEKMLLCYIQNGEKSSKDAHEAKNCAGCKYLIAKIFQIIGYISFVLWFFLPYVFAFATLVCM